MIILYSQTLSLFDFIFPVQVEGRVVTFRNMLYAAELLVKPQAGGQSNVGCPRVLLVFIGMWGGSPL